VKQKIEEVSFSNSWLLYLDAMKPPLTEYKYLGNLGRFFDSAKSLTRRAELRLFQDETYLLVSAIYDLS